MGRSTRPAALLIALVSVVAIALTAAGCAKKTRVTDETALSDYDTAGTEEGIGERGSLDRYRRGLAPEEDGILKDVHFAYDSYALDAVARDVLAANAEWLKDNPRARTEIEGHCDERGTIEYNLALGARRAKAVKDYLVSLGIAPERLSTISYGEELPLCREPNEACWARNRRAHFILPGE
jgi:peptidoglycan-associated lipoprotein